MTLGDLDGANGWEFVGSEPEPEAEAEPEPAPGGPAAGTKVTADAPLDITSGISRVPRLWASWRKARVSLPHQGSLQLQADALVVAGRCGGA